MEPRVVLSSADIDRATTRIAHQIVEANRGCKDLILIGIPTRGVVLANRIARAINLHYPDFDPNTSVGRLDITLYRDDLAHKPTKNLTGSSLPSSGIDGKTIVLIDDVLYSGRTIRAALDALNDFGRPRFVKLAVLIDRGHRELPIRADFVGKNLPTSLDERINVQLTESDSDDQVVIV